MKYSVIKAFTCKLDHRKYNSGNTYETDDPDRAEFLQSKGRLGAMIEELPPAVELIQQEPEHVGGGWYKLPSGKRIRGKKEAIAAMNGGE